MVPRDATKPQLYDLQDDLSETKDIVGEKPELAQRLSEAYDAGNAQMIPPMFEGLKKPAKKKKAGGKAVTTGQ